MTRSSRRNHTPVFKAKAALAALKGEETLTQLAERFDVHANQNTLWKSQLLEHAADVFASASERSADAEAVPPKELHAKIGQQACEHLSPARGPSGVPVPVASSAYQSTEPSVGRGHHLYPDGSRFRVPVRRDRLA